MSWFIISKKNCGRSETIAVFCKVAVTWYQRAPSGFFWGAQQSFTRLYVTHCLRTPLTAANAQTYYRWISHYPRLYKLCYKTNENCTVCAVTAGPSRSTLTRVWSHCVHTLAVVSTNFLPFCTFVNIWQDKNSCALGKVWTSATQKLLPFVILSMSLNGS